MEATLDMISLPEKFFSYGSWQRAGGGISTPGFSDRENLLPIHGFVIGVSDV
jgi:hypothetical protein